jgi:hypothetical protein
VTFVYAREKKLQSRAPHGGLAPSRSCSLPHGDPSLSLSLSPPWRPLPLALLWPARCISAGPRSKVADRAHVLGAAVTTGHGPNLWVESVGLDLFRFRVSLIRVSLIIASGG